MRSRFVREMVESLNGQKLMLGVDRLDYSKGIIHRLNAFDRFLEVNPEWRSKVTYLQVTPKSRGEIREYAQIENEVTTVISKINGRFGEAAWTPMRYVNRSYSRTALAGVYRAARRRAGDAAARRHESRRQGICRRAGSRRRRAC